MKPKRNCLWCTQCVQQDEDWFFCSIKEICFDRRKASAYRKCPQYDECWCAADDMNEMSDKMINQREYALYQRRMAGDWS